MKSIRYYVILCSLAAGQCLYGQQLGPQRDTSDVNLLNRMAMSLRETDHDLARRYADDALKLAEAIDYKKGKAAALGNIGWVYYRQSDFVKALQHSIESMKLAEEIGEKAEMARSMNSIAAVSYEQKQFDKSLVQFRKALAISYESGDEKVIGRTLSNIAYLFLAVNNQVDSAEVYGRRAVAYSERIKDSYLTAFGLRTMGDVLVRKGKFTEALAMYDRSIKLSEAGLNNSMKAATYHRVAKAYVMLGRNQEAIDILVRNAADAQKRGYLEELERTYRLLAEIHRAEGNHDKAYDLLHQYTVLHDTIYNQQNSRQIALHQNQFDLDMKQAQIELLTKDTELKQEEITNQRTQLYATILGSSCIFLLVVVMLYSFQKVKRTNKELESQKQELAASNLEVQEKSLELSLLNSTKDKLFSIIGHDFRSPLHSLKGLLELIGTKRMSQEEFERYSKDLKKKIDVVYDNLDNVLNWSVNQLQGIRTKPVRCQLALIVDEVFDLHSEMARAKKVFLNNDLDDDVIAFADKDQIRLVIRNLVSNALKFTSSGGYVRIWSQYRGHQRWICVQDSGVGMAASEVGKLFVRESLWSVKGTNNEKGLGLGLLLCKEFIEKNHGTLEVRSEQGIGSTISFSLPYKGNLVGEGLLEDSLSSN